MAPAAPTSVTARSKAAARLGRTGARASARAPVLGRRRSYLEHWAPLHDMTVEQATANFPKEARYGEPEEIAELMAFLVSPAARWMTRSTLRMDGGEVKSV